MVCAVPEVDERRQYQRVEPQGATVDAGLSDQSATQPATFDIDNLSAGGALIAGRINAPVGSVLDLRVNLPGMSSVTLSARLLRHVPRPGCEYTAVMFLSPSETLETWISDIVLQGVRAAFPEL